MSNYSTKKDKGAEIGGQEGFKDKTLEIKNRSKGSLTLKSKLKNRKFYGYTNIKQY